MQGIAGTDNAYVFLAYVFDHRMRKGIQRAEFFFGKQVQLHEYIQHHRRHRTAVAVLYLQGNAHIQILYADAVNAFGSGLSGKTAAGML